MKIATLTTFPLLVAGALVPPEHRIHALAETNHAMYRGLHKRQFWDSIGSTLSKHLPSLIQWGATNLSWLMKWTESPTKFAQLKPTIDPRATKIALRYGPFLLIGANETPQFATKPELQMDPKSTMFVRTLKGLPWNAAILSARISPVFEDGTPADFNRGIYIHHILIADLSKPSAPFALCPNLHKENTMVEWAWGYFMEAVGAGLIQTGNDAVGGSNIYMPQKGNIKSAFLTGKDDIFGIEGEIVNYNPTNKTVFLSLELEYLDQKPSDYIDASTIVISANGCKGPGYKPPQNAKKFVHVSEKFDITQNGYIINARGHLHDGGTAIELWLDNKVVCRSVPTYGVAQGSPAGTIPTILDMSWCHDSVPVRKGDALILKTYYDLDLHPLRQSSGTEGGHGHSGSAGNGTEKPMDPMDGMEEMGIMTTNFAWEISADAKSPITPQQAANTQAAKGDSTGSWLTSLLAPLQVTTATKDTKDSKEAKEAKEPAKSDMGNLLSWLFGGSSSTTSSPAPAQVNNQKDANDNKANATIASPTPSPSPSSSCNWFTSLLGCTDSPKPTPAAAAGSADKPVQPSGHSHS